YQSASAGDAAARIHGISPESRNRVARHCRKRDAHRHAWRRRVSLAGIQQPDLRAHRPVHFDHRYRRVPARPNDGFCGDAPALRLVSKLFARGYVKLAFVEVRNVSKSFVSATKTREVLNGVNLSVEEGEFVSIVGSTGSGKSTLLGILSGLLPADSGSVTVGGESVRGIHPHAAVVFQNYSLLPWFSALE